MTTAECLSLPTAAQNETSSLAAVARLHEGIKHVVTTARTINVEAINALLRAKKVGAQALGFGASSSELRRFSIRLSEIMEQLTADIGEQVKNVAALQVKNKMLRYERGALAQCRRVDSVLGRVLERKQCEVGVVEQAVAQGQQRLHLRLRQAERICQVGLSMARTAKIEAVYGGTMASQLNQVSCDIEAHIEDLTSTIKNLLRQH